MLDFENMQKYQTGFAIGIRYRPNFSIQDSFGSIIEKLLYDKNTFFSPSRFPKVLANQNERILFHPETGNKLTINTTDIILDILVKNEISEDKAIKNFGTEILQGILNDYKVKGINRIGLVRRYAFFDSSFISAFRNRIIKTEQKSVNNINLQFTRKSIVPAAKTNRVLSDYYNTIYSFSDISSSIEGQVGIQVSIDFQRIFVPPIESAQSAEYDKFIAAVKVNEATAGKFLNNNFNSEN